MVSVTHLRALRRRYHITLDQIAFHAGLSGQYISRAELGEIAATPRLEAQMTSAVESIISVRKMEIQALEEEYMTYKGCLLGKEEHADEQ